MQLSVVSHSIPVQGGLLHVPTWGTRGPVVVALHGLTASHIGFLALAEALAGDVRLVAPDLRGRGRSRDVEGPWGMQAHAADLVAVLDHLRIERADVVLGHSMGAFIGAVAAAHFPTRVAKLLMVDGGLPTLDGIPRGLDIETLVERVVGPSLQRLDMSFASREAYLDFWRPHPALAADWSPQIERYFEYDLVGTPPHLRSSVCKEAVLGDAASQLTGDLLPDAIATFTQPTRFLRAPRGVMNGDALYAEALLRDWAARKPNVSWANVPDVNHFTIVLSRRGAQAVADEIRAMLASSR